MFLDKTIRSVTLLAGVHKSSKNIETFWWNMESQLHHLFFCLSFQRFNICSQRPVWGSTSWADAARSAAPNSLAPTHRSVVGRGHAALWWSPAGRVPAPPSVPAPLLGETS